MRTYAKDENLLCFSFFQASRCATAEGACCEWHDAARNYGAVDPTPDAARGIAGTGGRSWNQKAKRVSQSRNDWMN